MPSGSPATSIGVWVTIPSIALELRSWPLPAYMVAPTRVDYYIPRLQDRAIDSQVPAQLNVSGPSVFSTKGLPN